MPRPFLTARWQNLAVVTWAVPPEVLSRFMPPRAPGLGDADFAIETRTVHRRGEKSGERGADKAGGNALTSGGGQAFISLVCFEFVGARVLGVKWPGQHTFAEMNLRFYVRAGTRRGVVFIREIVPKPLVAWAARRTYGEPYVTADLTSEVKQQQRSIGVEYRLLWPAGGLAPGETDARTKTLMRGNSARGGRGSAGAGGQPPVEMREHVVRLLGTKPVVRPGPDSLEQWFIHQQWGFGTGRTGGGAVYEVIHPLWGVYPVLETQIRMDFAAVFGVDFGFLSDAAPVSSVLAVGSEVAVFPQRSGVGVRWGERGAGRG